MRKDEEGRRERERGRERKEKEVKACATREGSQSHLAASRSSHELILGLRMEDDPYRRLLIGFAPEAKRTRNGADSVRQQLD